MRLSIVIPTLDEAAGIEACLAALQSLRARGHEVIVADGGSGDRTVSIARPLCDMVVDAPRGRASQMNAGAKGAGGEVLVFLHADTGLPMEADQLIARAMDSAAWGRFDVRIEGGHWLFPVIAALMNLRSRLTGIATGDQAIFLRREVFERLGGYAAIPLMEDVELSRRLRRLSMPRCLRACVSTSGRRWEKHGVWRTILLMWSLRLRYFLGASPAALAERYR